jgi:tetratricopeptide (TPR) repeat protein
MRLLFHLSSRALMFAVFCAALFQTNPAMSQAPHRAGLNAAYRSQDLMSIAKDQMESGRYAAAIRSYSAVISKSPQLAEAYLRRGKCNEQLGLIPAALRDFTKYIAMRPKDEHGYLARADAHNFNLDHEAALQDYENALKLAPGSASAHLGRGLAYAGLHRYSDAIKDYQWALQSNPDNVEALGDMGVACMLAGRRMEAMSYFERALKLEPDPQWRMKMEKWTEKLLQEAGALANTGEPKKKVGPRALW